MNTPEQDIQELLQNELTKCLAGIFMADECLGRTIAGMVDSLKKTTFEVEKDPCGYGRQYIVTILMENEVYWRLQGASLLNRPRTESKLLAAIRELISRERPHWNNSLVGKAIIKDIKKP